MSEPKQERWRDLCEIAIMELDPRRLTELFQQIEQPLAEGDAQKEPARPDSDTLGIAKPGDSGLPRDELLIFFLATQFPRSRANM